MARYWRSQVLTFRSDVLRSNAPYTSPLRLSRAAIEKRHSPQTLPPDCANQNKAQERRLATPAKRLSQEASSNSKHIEVLI